MDKMEQIKRNLHENYKDLDEQYIDDVEWLVERVEMLEKVLMTSDKCYKLLLEQVVNSNTLIRDIEEEYRTLHEKYVDVVNSK